MILNISDIFVIGILNSHPQPAPPIAGNMDSNRGNICSDNVWSPIWYQTIILNNGELSSIGPL